MWDARYGQFEDKIDRLVWPYTIGLKVKRLMVGNFQEAENIQSRKLGIYTIDNHKNKKQQNLQSSNGAFTLHMGNLDLWFRSRLPRDMAYQVSCTTKNKFQGNFSHVIFRKSCRSKVTHDCSAWSFNHLDISTKSPSNEALCGMLEIATT